MVQSQFTHHRLHHCLISVHDRRQWILGNPTTSYLSAVPSWTLQRRRNFKFSVQFYISRFHLSTRSSTSSSSPKSLYKQYRRTSTPTDSKGYYIFFLFVSHFCWFWIPIFNWMEEYSVRIHNTTLSNNPTRPPILRTDEFWTSSYDLLMWGSATYIFHFV